MQPDEATAAELVRTRRILEAQNDGLESLRRQRDALLDICAELLGAWAEPERRAYSDRINEITRGH